MSFTHGIWQTSGKLKSKNYNQDTLHSQNAMNLVLHERSSLFLIDGAPAISEIKDF